MVEHDWKRYPELTDTELAEFGFMSPHKQITEDFVAEVVKDHDGDTVTLRTNFRDFDFPLRLLDIDSPELNAGGEASRDWLKAKILNATVQVLIDAKNRVGKYGRLLGRILFNGLDIGQEELYLGLAKPFSQRHEGALQDLRKEFDISKWL